MRCHTLSILGRLLIPKLEMNQFLNNKIFPQTQLLLLLFRWLRNENPKILSPPLIPRPLPLPPSLSLSLSCRTATAGGQGTRPRHAARRAAKARGQARGQDAAWRGLARPGAACATGVAARHGGGGGGGRLGLPEIEDFSGEGVFLKNFLWISWKFSWIK